LLIGVAVYGLLFVSCRGNKEVTERRKLPNLKTEEILNLMSENEIKCDWMSLKYEVEVKTSDFDDSFKMYIRLRQDSAIWVSATYYAVEVARFLFTPDSVKFMDRKNNQYYVGGYDYITERFQIGASYEVLQSLILANTVSLLRAEGDQEKIRSYEQDGSYFLSYLRKGQLRRALKKDDVDEDMDLNIGLWIEPDHYRMDKTSINDFESNRTLTATYSNYKEACNSFYPYTTEYVAISANEQAEVKTSVMKLSSGKKVSLSFTIPDKYEALAP
jgi:hypothetical protein